MTFLPQMLRVTLKDCTGYLTIICDTEEEHKDAMRLINDLDEDGLIDGFDIVPQ